MSFQVCVAEYAAMLTCCRVTNWEHSQILNCSGDLINGQYQYVFSGSRGSHNCHKEDQIYSYVIFVQVVLFISE